MYYRLNRNENHTEAILSLLAYNLHLRRAFFSNFDKPRSLNQERSRNKPALNSCSLALSWTEIEFTLPLGALSSHYLANKRPRAPPGGGGGGGGGWMVPAVNMRVEWACVIDTYTDTRSVTVAFCGEETFLETSKNPCIEISIFLRVEIFWISKSWCIVGS